MAWHNSSADTSNYRRYRYHYNAINITWCTYLGYVSVLDERMLHGLCSSEDIHVPGL